MPRAKLISVFTPKSDLSSQHWTSEGRRYSCARLLEFADPIAEASPIVLSALREGYDLTDTDESKESAEFVERARRANMDHPILVVRARDGMLWIADGNHRYARALAEGRRTISARVIDEADIPEWCEEPK